MNVLKVLDIRREEKAIVFLFISYAFLYGFGMYMYYVAATTLFLSKFENTMLPIAYIVGGIMLHFIGRSNNFLQIKFKFSSVSVYLLVSLILSMGLLLASHEITSNKWIVFVLFLWIRTNLFVFNFTFWLSASRVFNLEQAKRIFSTISIGEVASSIVANLMVKLLLSNKVVGVEGLLFIAFTSIGLSLSVFWIIVRQNINTLTFTKARPDHPAPGEVASSSFFTNRYHLYLYLLGLLPVASLYLVEFNFSITSKKQYPNQVQLAEFLGQFLFLCSVIELLVKAFLYRFVTKTFGLSAGLKMMPFGLVLISVSIVGLELMGSSVFFLLLISRFMVTSIRRAFSDTSFQLLYQPIPAQESVHLQNQVESYAKPLGYIVAGGFLITLMQFKVVGTLEVYTLLLGVLGLWMLCSVLMLDEYRTRLMAPIMQIRNALRPAAVQATTGEPGPAEDNFSLEDLQALSESRNRNDRLTSARHLGFSKRYLAYRPLIKLMKDPDPGVRLAAIESAGRLRRTEVWPSLLSNLNEPPFRSATIEAMVALGESAVNAIEKSFTKLGDQNELLLCLLEIPQQTGGQKAIQFLRRNLYHPVPVIRNKVYEALSTLGYKANYTERVALLQEVDDKLTFYLWTIAAEADLADYLTDKRLLELLHLERQQVLSKIFNLLAVMYGDSRIDQLRNLLTDTSNRKGYLVEIANLVLPEEIKVRLLPIIEDVPTQEILQRSQIFYPQQSLSPRERLMDIVNKDPSNQQEQTRTMALYQLLSFPDEDLLSLFLAFAASDSEALSEVALYAIYTRSIPQFTELKAYFTMGNDLFHLSLCERISHYTSADDLLIGTHETAAPPNAMMKAAIEHSLEN
ncbi:hypothetical protein GCM10023187_39150 [Nibrella viscosa]|uniref:ATP/ADP translocase n=1 Tax=Nibrella viscosa TaxID=1084524 RepID=A0ABP8KQ35_9BACT